MIKKIIIEPNIERNLLRTIRREIVFDDNINVILARDTSQKDILMHSLAVKTWVKVGYKSFGWSDIHNIKGNYENRLGDLIREIEWSASSSFYVDYAAASMRMDMFMRSRLFHGIEDEYSVLFPKGDDNPSNVFRNLISYLNNLNEKDFPKIIGDSKLTYAGKEYFKNIRKDFISKNKKTKLKPTLLLDQIDVFFDLSQQKKFFKDTLKQLSKKYQLIITSNSIFALEENVIAIDDFTNELKDIL